MISRLLAGTAAALAAAASLGAAPKPAAKAAASQDWTRTVAETPEGGFRVGNPNAPVKLVEYGSLTCSHCAHFSDEAVPQLLAGPVKSGKVSFEFRNFVRDPVDMTGALLSHCAGTANYFALTHSIFASFESWSKRVDAMTEAQAKEINALPPAERLAKVASLVGFDTLAAKAGLPAAKAKQCLADQTRLERLAKVNQAATSQHNLQGTPTFLVNGKVVEAYDWATLQPLLTTPGG